ncbi:MAG: Crp/Fnr family transcriptional regulator [Chitinophagales bacterium]|nr:Crp/Fnr family transcriptional regulator [Chitinophagales bacterium]
MKIREVLAEFFPDIDDENLIKEIEQHAKISKLEENQILMDYGQIIPFIPLLFEGKIKIFKEDDEGHELFLYYIYPGQGCAVAFACFDKMSSVRAQAVEASRMLAVPSDLMEKWMMKYPAWNRFVLRVYNQRFDEVLDTLNEVAFHKLDERLLDYLDKQSYAMESKELNLTHAQIATELNTSREVISRLLKKLEQQGSITMSRNKIALN